MRAPAAPLLVPPSKHMHSNSFHGLQLCLVLPSVAFFRHPVLLLFDKAVPLAPTALTSPPFSRNSLFLSAKGSGKQNQSQVAATMGTWGNLYQPHFVVALGKERGREGESEGREEIQLRWGCHDR